MEFTRDDRGVSEVIGAILVFGLLVALLAVMQTYAVPLANADVEFNHNQEVQSDLVKFQETASRTASQGTTESTKVQMGTNYPARLLFFSPNNPAGEIRTVGDDTARVDNIVAADPTVEKYISGSTDDLETKRIEYEPGYNEYRNPPTTVLEYGVLYNDFGEERVIENPGSVVNGNSINLMFFAGDLSRTSGTALSLESKPTSAPARTVTVRPQDPNQDVTITVPSRLTPGEWEEVLSEEISDGNVEGVVNGQGETVVIHLDPTVNRYTLRMPKIGVGSAIEEPPARYIIGEDGTSGIVGLDSSRDVTFEVRDKYNNPVRGETVYIGDDSNMAGSLEDEELTTDSQGQVHVRYNAPPDEAEDTIQVSFDEDPDTQGSAFEPDSDPKDMEYDVTVVDRGIPSGDSISASITVNGGTCNQDVPLGLLGDEAAELSVDWSAQMTSNNNGNTLDSVRIRMVDQDNNQLATSTEYDYDSARSAGETITMRDERPNDNSCSKNYEVTIYAVSDGNRPAQANDTIDSDQIVA